MGAEVGSQVKSPLKRWKEGGDWSWGGVGGQGSEVKEGEGLRLGGVREQGLGRKESGSWAGGQVGVIGWG